MSHFRRLPTWLAEKLKQDSKYWLMADFPHVKIVTHENYPRAMDMIRGNYKGIVIHEKSFNIQIMALSGPDKNPLPSPMTFSQFDNETLEECLSRHPLRHYHMVLATKRVIGVTHRFHFRERGILALMKLAGFP